MAYSFVWTLTLTFAFLGPFASFGQLTDSERIERKLAQARNQYQASQRKLRNEVLDQLGKIEKKARTTGDDKLIASIVKERPMFEESDILPSVLNGEILYKRNAALRSSLANSLESSRRSLIKQGYDEQAEKVQGELTELLESGDALQDASVWGGLMEKLRLNRDLDRSGWELRITDRDGSTIQGHVKVGNGNSFSVKGKVEHGKVNLTSPDNGLRFSGIVRGYILRMNFEGFSQHIKQPIKGRITVEWLK